MTVQLGDAGVVQLLDDAQERGAVGRHRRAVDAQDERLVALVATAVQQVGRLGVGAAHDDAGHAHDVQLEAGRGGTLDLLVARHQDLAALVAALLGTRLLVLDVVPGHAHLGEAPDEVAHVGVTAVAGVGVGDDERAEVHLGGGGALGLAHVGAHVGLVPVRCEQRADDGRGLVRHLAQRVRGEVGPRVLVDGALGAGGPAAQVDALDAGALLGYRLARRVRPVRGDGLAIGEQLAQPGVEALCGLSGHSVVLVDGALLLGHHARGVDAGDVREARRPHVLLGLLDLGVECRHEPSLVSDCRGPGILSRDAPPLAAGRAPLSLACS